MASSSAAVGASGRAREAGGKLSALLEATKGDIANDLKRLTARVESMTRHNVNDDIIDPSGKRPSAYYPVSVGHMLKLLWPTLSKTKRDAIHGVRGLLHGLRADGVEELPWLPDVIIDNFVTAVAADACRLSPVRIWRPINSAFSGSYQTKAAALEDALVRLNGDHHHSDVVKARGLITAECQAIWKQLGFSHTAEFFRTCQGILMPFCHGKNHWTLLVINGIHRRIRVLDSVKQRDARPEFGFALALLKSNLGVDDFFIEDWTLARLDTAEQNDVSNCGVFVCANALALCKGIRPKTFVDSVLISKLNMARRYIAACLTRKVIVKAEGATRDIPLDID